LFTRLACQALLPHRLPAARQQAHKSSDERRLRWREIAQLARIAVQTE
jgi:hypothetical protein